MNFKTETFLAKSLCYMFERYVEQYLGGGLSKTEFTVLCSSVIEDITEDHCELMSLTKRLNSIIAKMGR